MDRISETDRTGGLGTAVISREVPTGEELQETAPSPWT